MEQEYFWLQPDSRRIEFKETWPGGNQIAHTAIAFANGAGGRIVFGVKELKLIEAWGTGIQKMQFEISKYPEIELSMNETGNAFQVQFINTMYEEAYVEAHEEAHVDLSNLELKILSILEGKPVNIQELLSGCGYSTRTGNFKISLTSLKETGLLEMTIPDKPRSRKQKYRITEKGKRIFNKKKLKNE